MCFFFSSRRRHTRCSRDWSSDVCSSDLLTAEDTQDPLLHEFTSLRAALRMEHVTDGPELLQNMQQIQNQFDSLEGGGEALGRQLRVPSRSEEHTSELQSRLHLVCRLLLE